MEPESITGSLQELQEDLQDHALLRDDEEDAATQEVSTGGGTSDPNPVSSEKVV